MTNDLQNLLNTLPPEQRQQWHNAIVEATGERSAGDYDWVDPDDHLKGIKLDNGLKTVGRKANGERFMSFRTDTARYNVLPIDHISLMRWHEFQKYSMVAGTGMSFSAIIQAFRENTAIALKRGITHEEAIEKIVLFNKSTIDRMVDFSAERWESTYKSATFFIAKEGEDLTKWAEEEQYEKVLDWNRYGLINGDIFFYLGQFTNGFAAFYQNMGKESQRNAGTLLEAGNITATRPRGK